MGTIKQAYSPTSLSVGRYRIGSTNFNSYVVFGGGCKNNTSGGKYYITNNTVDMYNASLTRSTSTLYDDGDYYHGVTSTSEHAIFGPHASTSNSLSKFYYTDATSAFNKSFSRTTLWPGHNYGGLGAASIGDYALFAGGYKSNSYNGEYSAAGFAYNTSLTKISLTALSAARRNIGAINIGDYAIFAGGNYSNVVDAYDSSLTRFTPTVLSQARDAIGVATVGNYALFAGGSGNSVYNTVDAYDTSLTRSTPTALSLACSNVSGASINNKCALFVEGSENSSVVEAYDTSLTKSSVPSFESDSRNMGSGSVGNYAIFAGGGYDRTGRTAVYAYVYIPYILKAMGDIYRAYKSTLMKIFIPNL